MNDDGIIHSIDDLLKATSADDVKLDEGAQYLIDNNLKIFRQSITTISRFSDQLYIELSVKGLSLKALNSSKSAFASITLTQQFFSEIDLSKLDLNSSNLCRISMKSALSIFGRSGTNASENRVQLSCKLQIDPKADYLIVHMAYMYFVTKCFVIPLRDCVITYKHLFNDKTKLRNRVTLPAKNLLTVLSQIGCDLDEIKIVALPDRFSIERFFTVEDDRNRIRKTTATIDIDCFERYHLQYPSEVAVNLKELKAVLHFADITGLSINLHFDQPGRPIIVALEENIDFIAEFVLATFEGICRFQTENLHEIITTDNPVNNLLDSDLVKKNNDDAENLKSQAVVTNNNESVTNTDNNYQNENEYQLQDEIVLNDFAEPLNENLHYAENHWEQSTSITAIETYDNKNKKKANLTNETNFESYINKSQSANVNKIKFFNNIEIDNCDEKNYEFQKENKSQTILDKNNECSVEDTSEFKINRHENTNLFVKFNNINTDQKNSSFELSKANETLKQTTSLESIESNYRQVVIDDDLTYSVKNFNPNVNETTKEDDSTIYDCLNLSCSPSTYLNGERPFNIRLSRNEMEKLENLNQQMLSQSQVDSEPNTSFVTRLLDYAVEKTKPLDRKSSIFNQNDSTILNESDINLSVPKTNKNDQIITVPAILKDNENFTTPNNSQKIDNENFSPQVFELNQLESAIEKLKNKVGGFKKRPNSQLFSQQNINIVADHHLKLFNKNGFFLPEQQKNNDFIKKNYLNVRKNVPNDLAKSSSSEISTETHDSFSQISNKTNSNNIINTDVHNSMKLLHFSNSEDNTKKFYQTENDSCDVWLSSRNKSNLNADKQNLQSKNNSKTSEITKNFSNDYVGSTISASSSIVMLEEDFNCDGGWLRKPSTQKNVVNFNSANSVIHSKYKKLNKEKILTEKNANSVLPNSSEDNLSKIIKLSRKRFSESEEYKEKILPTRKVSTLSASILKSPTKKK